LIGCGYNINTQTYITKVDLNEKQIFFTWRKKHTNAEIYQQYLDKVYVLKLVLCKFFPEYGNAICNQAATIASIIFGIKQVFVRKRCLSGGDNMRTTHSGRVFVTKT